MKKIAIIAIVVLSLLFTMSLAAAAEPGDAGVSGEVDRGEYVFDVADSNTTVTSGSIRYVDLDTNFSTYRWAGILGNVTGNIILGDSSDDILFTWTAKGRVVYASEAASITWGSLVYANSSTIAAYTNGGSDSDNYTNTFVDTGDINSGIYTGLTAAPRATTLGGSGWYTYALYDGTNVVFAGNVEQAGDTAYDGTSTVSYQMIVPEDGTADDVSATEYNLWVELQ